MLLNFWWWRRRLPTPRDGWYAVKAFIQRGRRGWADHDNWSMYSYLSVVMADMLKDLREKGHGYHCVHGDEVRGEHMMDSDLCGPEDWWAMLHRIEFALRYYIYVYDDDAHLDYDFDTWRSMMETAETIKRQAFADLGEYWGGLWD